jgi:hypothetical protein
MTLQTSIDELKDLLVKLAISLIQAVVWFLAGVGTSLAAGSTGKAMWIAGVTAAIPYLVGNMQRTGGVRLTLDGFKSRRNLKQRASDKA